MTLSAQNGDDKTVAHLIGAGARIDDIAGKENWTPLILAAQHSHAAIVDRLLLAGANKDLAAFGGRTALILAAENGHDAIVEMLIIAGDQIDRAKSDGETALIAAAKNGHIAVVERLLKAGAKTDLVGDQGETALFAATKVGHSAVVACLIAHGADVNLANYDSETPLMQAVNDIDEKLVELLLSNGADPLLADGHDLTALEIAHRRNARGIIATLHKAGVPPLSEAELQLSVTKKKKVNNIGLVVNAHGKLCLVHDNKFESTPLWVGYHLEKRMIEIFFESGTTYPIDWSATDEMDDYLQKVSKILIIRMRNKKPVEGYDTSVMHFKNGKPIEMEGHAMESMFNFETHFEPETKAVDTSVNSAAEEKPSGVVSETTRLNSEFGLSQPTLVYFWAEWVGPCRSFSLVLNELPAELDQGISIVKVNVDEQPDLAAKFGIRSLPTLLLF